MSAQAPVRVVVSIVTWRAPGLTIDCLASLESEVAASEGVKVLVVDNASGDGTAEQISAAIEARGWAGWARLVRSGVNGGFAAGNNVAFRHAAQIHPEFEYLLLVNPDTIVSPGAVGELSSFMKANPGAGIAGGLCTNADGSPQVSSFGFPGVISEFADQLRLGLFDRLVERHLVRRAPAIAPVRVDWVTGAMMMVRRKVFEDIGLMDEGYFLYFEETDFSMRAARAGWPTWHVPRARCIHLMGQLTGVQSGAPKPRRLPDYWFDSRRRYFLLNHGLPYAVLVDLGVLAGNALWQLRRLIERKPDTHPPYWVRDLTSRGVLRRGRSGLAERRIG